MNVQFCEYTKSHWIVPFKCVTSIVYELCLSKATCKKKKKSIWTDTSLKGHPKNYPKTHGKGAQI